MASSKDAMQQVSIEKGNDEVKLQIEDIDCNTKQKKHRRKRGKKHNIQHSETYSEHLMFKAKNKIPGTYFSDEVDGCIINQVKQTVVGNQTSTTDQSCHGRQFRGKITRPHRHQIFHDKVKKSNNNMKFSSNATAETNEQSGYGTPNNPQPWVELQNSVSARQTIVSKKHMSPYSTPLLGKSLSPKGTPFSRESFSLNSSPLSKDCFSPKIFPLSEDSLSPKGSSSSRESLSHKTSPLFKEPVSPKGRKSSKKKTQNVKKLFEEYWDKDDLSDALKRGLIFQGSLRISPKNYEMAWVTVKEYKRDVMILGMQPRNRALDGDIVALQILPKENWKILHQEMKFYMDNDVSATSKNKSVEEMKSGVKTQQEFEDAVEKLKGIHLSLEKENCVQTSTMNSLKFHETKVCIDETEKSGSLHVIQNEENSGENSKNEDGKGQSSGRNSLKITTKTLKNEKEMDITSVPEEYVQRTAKVVYIIEVKHPRVACGYLRPMSDPKDPDGLFSPTDCRLPRLRVARDDCPAGFFDRPQDFASTLMIARLTDWKREAPRDSFFAKGVFARSLGEAGEIEPETESILAINEIDTSPFTQDVLDCLPKQLPWKIPLEELEARRDFREYCVFTIDPSSARDLDDALHCIQLDDGFFEIGVHIADVSYFVKDDTALDKVACLRATSTYMVQKVIPMLPRLLCEELCSLNPCEDRLTFSVVWKVDKNGAIHDEWIGKGIILSRAKLSYEHAQEMIDKPEKVWKEEEHPLLANGASVDEIANSVRNLNKIALKLRHKRFENGTLRLNKAKVFFNLDRETGLPIGWHEYIQRESNKLIEEYMLLANMAVARRIYFAFPHKALLRCHPKPDSRQLEEICALCKPLGVDFGHESSKGIQDTLNTFTPNSPEYLVLSHLCMKPMKPAKYFSSATAEGDPEEFKHYALSVPLYTHFTSPIRRYPDIIVHRLLAASLGVEDAPEFVSEDLQVIADHCNDRKLAAKKASEASINLYLGAFVRDCGPLTEDGIVVSVMNESLDVLVPHFAIIKRVYFKFSDEVKSFQFQEGHKDRPAKVVVTWKGPYDERKTDDLQEKRHADKKIGGHGDVHPTSTASFKIFSPVKILLKTEGDNSKNKSGLKFSGELLPNLLI